jgi:hypothetical protein
VEEVSEDLGQYFEVTTYLADRNWQRQRRAFIYEEKSDKSNSKHCVSNISPAMFSQPRILKALEVSRRVETEQF